MGADGKFRFYDVADVRAAAKDGWFATLGKCGVDTSLLTGRHTKCPGCGGKNRFRYDDKEGNGTFLCSQGTGEILSGDGLTLLAHALGITWAEAIQKTGDIVCPDKVRVGQRGQVSQGEAGEKRQWLPPVPEKPVTGANKFDLATLRKAVRADLKVDDAWLAERSPVDVGSVGSPEDYLSAVFAPTERVLIFTDYYSQGDVIFQPDKGAYRLADKAGVKAVRLKAIPTRVENDGMWYLSQPVDGGWKVNPRGKADEAGELPLARRIYECFTDWRHLVLESDEAPDGLWLNFIVQLPLPIVAIYRSGARSVHTLIRLDNHSLPGFQAIRKQLLPMLSKFGACPGALTANRLTRLPLGQRKVVRCEACGKVMTAKKGSTLCKCGVWLGADRARWVTQSLLYLNPKPEPGGLPICEGGNRLF
jgi:hypothetical protein